MMAAETRRFDFENGRSVQPNNTSMLCGHLSDSGLYSFCYRRITITNNGNNNNNNNNNNINNKSPSENAKSASQNVKSASENAKSASESDK